MKTSNTKQSLVKLAHKLPVETGLGLAIAATIVGISGTALAYGPARPTYTIEKPASHITFNSITNNGAHGDERNFVQAKDATITTDGGWKDDLTVEPGKEYLIRMYVHNNASANLNLVAQNTRVMANVPTTTGNSVQIDGFVSANNANPQKVWDDVVLRSDKKFNIAYVQGSARYYNNVNPSTGFQLADSIVTNAGAQVGYRAMDGNVPGCYEYSGIATFKVKIQGEASPNFTVKKDVRLHGTSAWAKNITAKPGEKVDYRIGYDNTGQTQQNNVVIKDQLPAGVSYVAGSTTVKNASNPNSTKVNDTITTTQGLNIGNYAPRSNAFAYFTATLPNGDKLRCGQNVFNNIATVQTENGGKSDNAAVTVNVECQPNECKPGIPTGDARCNDVVAAPTSLPKTGPAEVILSLIGFAALAAGIAYFIKSRQDLKKAMAAGGPAANETAADAPKLLKARTDTNPVDDKKDL